MVHYFIVPDLIQSIHTSISEKRSWKCFYIYMDTQPYGSLFHCTWPHQMK